MQLEEDSSAQQLQVHAGQERVFIEITERPFHSPEQIQCEEKLWRREIRTRTCRDEKKAFECDGRLFAALNAQMPSENRSHDVSDKKK